MEPTQALENRILERLTIGTHSRDLFIETVNLLTEIVGDLILQAFRKDDYAVKYAVEPLLKGNGPLGALPVRLKLIYGLGFISRNEYEDCLWVIARFEELHHTSREYAFSDNEIVGALGALHCISRPPPEPPARSEDPVHYRMQCQRYQQIVRSTLVLSLTHLLAGIGTRRAFGH